VKNDYTVSDDRQTATIWLNRRKGERLACLIAVSDLPKLQALNVSWYASWSPRARAFYAQCNVPAGRKRTTLTMHGYIMDAPRGLEVDHLNHKTLDNRRCNLEIKTRSGNMMNRRGATRISKTGHRGISPHRAAGKFELDVTVNGKRKYIGLFSTIAEAIAVRDKFPGYGKKQLGHSEGSL
jgi:hypothetical protein